MKKIIAISLSLSISFSIAACGGTPARTTETPTPEFTPTPKPTSTSTPLPTPTPIGGGSGQILYSDPYNESAPLGNGLVMQYRGYTFNHMDLVSSTSEELISVEKLEEVLGKKLYKTRYIPSPDGKKVIITASSKIAEEGYDTYEYYITSLDLGDLTQIPDAGATFIEWQWSTDSSMLLGDALTQNKKSLLLINSDGSGLEIIAENRLIISPHLSMDGSRIYFIESGQPRVMDIDGSNELLIAELDFELWSMRFSPDESKVAFFTRTDNEETTYFVSDADFSENSLISGSIPACYGRISPKVVEWSPDSRYVYLKSYVCINLRGQLIPNEYNNLLSIEDNEPIYPARGKESGIIGYCSWTPDGRYSFIHEGNLKIVDLDNLDPWNPEFSMSYADECPFWVP